MSTSFERIEFTPANATVLTWRSLKQVLETVGEGVVKADIGLRYVRVRKFENKVAIEGCGEFDVETLEEAVEKGDETWAYALVNGEVFRVAIWCEHKFYKLRVVGEDTAPTLEISGIHMHRIVDVKPWEDARMKVSVAKVRRGCRVLDTCMGLGYTAIHSMLRGADVVTVEVDENVIEIARYNPWSRMLEKATVIRGDVFEVIDSFDPGEFDRVIHDPPRFSLAGHLYSEEFYKKIYRVLKTGGVLYHYTGAPGSRTRNIKLARGVVERLRRVGFVQCRYIDSVQGVVAVKL